MKAPHAVVLAAGAGRRMWPFGATQHKALLPVGPRPLLARTLDQLRGAGCADVCVVSGGPHNRAVAGFCALHAAHVRVVEGVAPTGTADALLAGWPAGGAGQTGPVLCVYGDVWLAQGALEALLAAAAGAPERVHLLAAPLGGERPQDWLCVAFDGDGRVSSLSGHPRGGSHRVAGAFVLPDGFDRYLRGNHGRGLQVPVGGMPPAEAHLEESVNLLLADGGAASAVPAGVPAVDLDKPWHILAANRAEVQERLRGAEGVHAAAGARVAASADVRAPVILEPGSELGERVIVRAPLYLCEGARVTDGAIIAGPSLVARGARVEDYARLSGAVIGPGAVVGHCAEVDGVVMEGAYIVHYSEIYGVVGRGVDIGAATVCGSLRFDDGVSRQRVGGPEGRRWEVPVDDDNASYLGDYSRTGVNVTFQPGRSVGPYSCVGPSVLVSRDIPERTLVLLRQDLVETPWGPERYGW